MYCSTVYASATKLIPIELAGYVHLVCSSHWSSILHLRAASTNHRPPSTPSPFSIHHSSHSTTQDIHAFRTQESRRAADPGHPSQSQRGASANGLWADGMRVPIYLHSARSGPSSCPKPSWSHAHSGGAGLRGLDRSACGLGSLFCRWQGFAIPYAVGATMSSFSSSPLPSPLPISPATRSLRRSLRWSRVVVGFVPFFHAHFALSQSLPSWRYSPVPLVLYLQRAFVRTVG